MKNVKIYDVIIELLENKLKVNPNILVQDNFNTPLTGRMFGLYARDLVYLFFEVERTLKINISLDHLQNNKFNTINGIYELIVEQNPLT